MSSSTWDNLTADAEALRERLGFGRWAVLGHSFGNRVALEYALRYPGSISHLAAPVLNPSWLSSPAESRSSRLAVCGNPGCDRWDFVLFPMTAAGDSVGPAGLPRGRPAQGSAVKGGADAEDRAFRDSSG